MKFIVALILIIGIGTAVFVSQQNKTAQITIASPTPIASTLPVTTPYTAHFAIFTNGTFRDFSNERYHNRSTDVYLTNDNPNKISINKTGITWQNFFDTLPSPMKVTRECLTTGTGQVFCNNETADLRFFLNGKVTQNALEKVIQPNDKMLVSFGTLDKEKELEKLDEVSN